MIDGYEDRLRVNNINLSHLFSSFTASDNKTANCWGDAVSSSFSWWYRKTIHYWMRSRGRAGAKVSISFTIIIFQLRNHALNGPTVNSIFIFVHTSLGYVDIHKCIWGKGEKLQIDRKLFSHSHNFYVCKNFFFWQKYSAVLTCF